MVVSTSRGGIIHINLGGYLEWSGLGVSRILLSDNVVLGLRIYLLFVFSIC